MKKTKKNIDKGLPTDFGSVGKLLDDASNDLPNQFANLLDSVAEGFQKFFSPPYIKRD